MCDCAVLRRSTIASAQPRCEDPFPVCGSAADVHFQCAAALLRSISIVRLCCGGHFQCVAVAGEVSS